MIDQVIQNLKVTRADHLSVAAAFCHQMGLVESINRVVPTQMEMDVGSTVLAMVLDTLSGRNPLYRLADFFKFQDAEYLLGKTLPATAFNDTTLGRTMDTIFDAGAEKMFNDVALQAVKQFPIDLNTVHFDTTSVNVWGAYDSETNLEDILNITYGYSKDHRPDLKQFLIKMLCAGGNIPIMGSCEDGNASDKTINNNILTRISKHMAQLGKPWGSYVYVADSAMVTETNLAVIGKNLFITRLPFTYKEANQLVSEAVCENQWHSIGTLNETPATSKRPAAIYSCCEKKVTLYGQEYRAVVVYSSAHDKRRLKRMERDIKKSEIRFNKILSEAMKREYFCYADAEAAVTKLMASKQDYHFFEAEVLEDVHYARGRPRKDGSRKIVGTHYWVQGRVLPREDQIKLKREESGCFILLTNVPLEGEHARKGHDVLLLYKEQHGIERNFSFLKDPLIVNDLFLKKPQRIEALGAVLLIALLVKNLMEHVLRTYISSQNETLMGWNNQQTTRPTTFMMTTKFYGILILNYMEKRAFERPLSPVQLKYLKALGLTPNQLLYPGHTEKPKINTGKL